MPKPDRLLLILQLLSHRRAVSLEMIMSSCGIPERTAYRYLSAISNANIPVYYDRERGGYTLARPVDIRLDDLTLQEMVLLVTSLRLVQQRVNAAYRTEFDLLISRVMSRQKYSFGAFAMDSVTGEDLAHDGQDLSEEISFALVQAAIAEGRKLAVHLPQSEGKGNVEVAIDEPRLLFDGGWRVTSPDQEKISAARLTQVEKIKIS